MRDLNSNAEYRLVLKAVSPILTVVDSKNPLAQAISAISQAGPNPAAFELGRIVYGAKLALVQDVAGTHVGGGQQRRNRPRRAAAKAKAIPALVQKKKTCQGVQFTLRWKCLILPFYHGNLRGPPQEIRPY